MTISTTQNISIKELALDDRPREKLVAFGRSYLSDAELIAILIGSGSRIESAVQLSQRILSFSDNNINNLAKLSIEELKQFKGIGEAKAISIIAALELGRRHKSESQPKRPIINSSKDSYNIIKHKLEDLPYEEFWIILLSRANKVKSTYLISRGGITETVVDVKIILKKAIDNLASGLILVHNHPSGNLKPSQSDLNLTKKIQSGATIMDIQLLDHLIIGDGNYYSFADNSLL